MTNQNRQFKLAARPVGMVKRSDFEFSSSAVPEPGPGEVLIRVMYVSLDPAMRGWMNEGRSYIPPVAIGEVMRAGTAGKVVKSNNPNFAAGDYVAGWGGVQDYVVSDGKDITKVDPRLAPLPVFLGTLGMPGMTAYFGLLDVGKPKEGETVVVSGAAGAVGTVVGQVAKIKGCRVVGIAGGPDKCAWLVKELGFDAAIDYKKEDVNKALREHCPKGVDVYFDNVGGDILDAALARMARNGRIVICGAISQYNNTNPVKGPSNYLSLLVNRASMTGMVVMDYTARFGEAVREMAGWMKAGKLKTREDIVDGLETFPETLLMLFKGENTGKLLIKVADAEEPVHPFDAAIHLEERADGNYLGHTSDKYWNFVGPFGGMTAATALNGILQRHDKQGDPLSLTVNFMAPIKAGAFTIGTRLLRSNRSTQHWAVELVQEGETEPALSAIAVFAARRDTWGLREAVPPETRSAADCKVFKVALEIRWPAMYEMRYARGRFGVENPDSLTHCWISDSPPRVLDHASLTAICDAFFPRIFLRRPRLAPIATVSLNIYFHVDSAELAKEGAAPVLCVAKAQVFNKGYYDQEGQVWGKDGVLLATTQQIAWYKE